MITNFNVESLIRASAHGFVNSEPRVAVVLETVKRLNVEVVDVVFSGEVWHDTLRWVVGTESSSVRSEVELISGWLSSASLEILLDNVVVAITVQADITIGSGCFWEDDSVLLESLVQVSSAVQPHLATNSVDTTDHDSALWEEWIVVSC